MCVCICRRWIELRTDIGDVFVMMSFWVGKVEDFSLKECSFGDTYREVAWGCLFVGSGKGKELILEAYL